MYSSFLGEGFLNAYKKNRLKNIGRFSSENYKYEKKEIDLYFCFEFVKKFESIFEQDQDIRYKIINEIEIFFNLSSEHLHSLSELQNNFEKISCFNINEGVNTESLLSSMIYNQLNLKENDYIKSWADFLVRRFEVSKKINVNYESHYTQEIKETKSLRLYWLFSLFLTIYYINTKKIKYLNTLLKVNDLVCSVKNNSLFGKIPPQGLVMVISAEVISIRELSKNINGALCS